MNLLFLLIALPYACSGKVPVFVLRGRAARLIPGQIGEQEMESVTWTLNASQRILNYNYKFNDLTAYKDYATRVEFDQKNLMLLMHNVTEKDNGLYTARVTQKSGAETSVSDFLLSVQARVDPPVFSVVFNSPSSDSCNVSLTCTSHNHTLTSICDNSTCSPVEEYGPDLTLSVMGSTVICNSSNQVSWSNTTMEISEICKMHADVRKGGQTQVVFLSLFTVVFTLILFMLTLAYCRHTRSPDAEKSATVAQDRPQSSLFTVSTEYDVIRMERCTPPLSQKDSELDTVYARVQKPQWKNFAQKTLETKFVIPQLHSQDT